MQLNRVRKRRYCWAPLLLVCVCGVSAQYVTLAAPVTSEITIPVKPESKPPYWREPRLSTGVQLPVLHEDLPRQRKQRLRPLALLQKDTREDTQAEYLTVRVVRGRVVPLEELLRAVSASTGAKVRAQADWGRSPILAPEVSTPARELMDSMAEAFRGQWLQFSDTWILARTSIEAQFTLMPSGEREVAQKQASRTLFTLMSPERWQKLAAAGRMEMAKLHPDEARAVMQKVRLAYYDPDLPPGSPAPLDLTGRGVLLEYVGTGAAALVRIWTEHPAPHGFRMDIPFYDPAGGQLLWGVLPPR